MSEASLSPVVTIDGPSGSGKGTISRAVAQAVGWHLLDSGALYRLVALAGARAGAGARGPPPARRARHRDAGAVRRRAPTARSGCSWRARTSRRPSAPRRPGRVPPGWPPGRRCAALLGRQRAFAQPPGLVADGRDMGTVVFPEAPLKIFLTASPDERALRRYKQLKDKGSGVSLPALSREIAERDARDQTRRVAPLRPAPDACVIDSTGMPVEAVVGRVLGLGAARGLWRQ